MTPTQLAKVAELKAIGWSVDTEFKHMTFGGPTVMKKPDGKRYCITASGSVVATEDFLQNN